MPEKYPYEKRYWYPHMKPADIVLWERYIEAYPNAYDSVSYDTPCGTGRPCPTDTPDFLAADWKILTQPKLDVVGFTPDYIDIIEVKPKASWSALMQAMGGAKLFFDTYAPVLTLYPTIICSEISPDMQSLADHHQIKIYIV